MQCLPPVSASDNPPILSGEKGQGGVALLWDLSLDDFITPLKCLFRYIMAARFFIR